MPGAKTVGFQQKEPGKGAGAEEDEDGDYGEDAEWEDPDADDDLEEYEKNAPKLKAALSKDRPAAPNRSGTYTGPTQAAAEAGPTKGRQGILADRANKFGT